MIRRADRYILKEMLVPAFIGGVLVLVLLVGNWLYALLKALYEGASVFDALHVIFYRIPSILMLSLPASLLLGTSLALNRLERDRELMSLRMAGVRLFRLVVPYLMMGLLFSGALFYLQEKVIPQFTHEAEKLTRKLVFHTPAAFVPYDVVFKVGQQYVYVHRVDPETKTLYDAIICKVDQGPTWLIIPEATYQSGKWVFKENPLTHKQAEFIMFNRDRSGFISGKAGEVMMNLNQDFMDYISDQPTTPDELNFTQLKDLSNGIRGNGVGMGFSLTPDALIFQLNRKIAAPLAALVAVLIAIPLSVHFGRSGGYTGLLLSVVIAFCFVVSQQWAQVLAETHRLPPLLAAWAPDGIFGLLGLVLLMKEE